MLMIIIFLEYIPVKLQLVDNYTIEKAMILCVSNND